MPLAFQLVVAILYFAEQFCSGQDSEAVGRVQRQSDGLYRGGIEPEIRPAIRQESSQKSSQKNPCLSP
jgi:hypothetical protein